MVGDAQTTRINLSNTVGQNPCSHQVEQYIACHHDKGTLNHRPPGNFERLNQRGLDLLIVLDGLSKDRGFFELETHIQTHGNHEDGEQERNTPAPNQEGVIEVLTVCGGVEGNPAGQKQHESVSKNEANGRAQLGPHSGTCALAFFGIFAGEQSRTRPFATQT